MQRIKPKIVLGNSDKETLKKEANQWVDEIRQEYRQKITIYDILFGIITIFLCTIFIYLLLN